MPKADPQRPAGVRTLRTLVLGLDGKVVAQLVVGAEYACVVQDSRLWACSNGIGREIAPGVPEPSFHGDYPMDDGSPAEVDDIALDEPTP